MLLHTGSEASVFTDDPVIKAAEFTPFERALDLLEEARRVRDQALHDAECLREQARVEGLRQGVDEAKRVLVDQLGALTHDIAQQQRHRDEELSSAALAAVQAIIGAAGVAAIGPALVTQALDGFVGDQSVVIEVAPELAAQITDSLASRPEVTVVANTALKPLDCMLRTGRGTIRAGLDVQIAALAERWEAAP